MMMRNNSVGRDGKLRTAARPNMTKLEKKTKQNKDTRLPSWQQQQHYSLLLLLLPSLLWGGMYFISINPIVNFVYYLRIRW